MTVKTGTLPRLAKKRKKSSLSTDVSCDENDDELAVKRTKKELPHEIGTRIIKISSSDEDADCDDGVPTETCKRVDQTQQESKTDGSERIKNSTGIMLSVSLSSSLHDNDDDEETKTHQAIALSFDDDNDNDYDESEICQAISSMDTAGKWRTNQRETIQQVTAHISLLLRALNTRSIHAKGHCGEGPSTASDRHRWLDVDAAPAGSETDVFPAERLSLSDVDDCCGKMENKMMSFSTAACSETVAEADDEGVTQSMSDHQFVSVPCSAYTQPMSLADLDDYCMRLEAGSDAGQSIPATTRTDSQSAVAVNGRATKRKMSLSVEESISTLDDDSDSEIQFLSCVRSQKQTCCCQVFLRCSCQAWIILRIVLHCMPPYQASLRRQHTRTLNLLLMSVKQSPQSCSQESLCSRTC
jgi:hypothetical protein